MMKEIPQNHRFKSVKLGVDAEVEFVYPWLPPRCTLCSKWGHLGKEFSGKGGDNQVKILARDIQSTDVRSENAEGVSAEAIVVGKEVVVVGKEGEKEVQDSVTGVELMVVETPNQVQIIETKIADTQEEGVVTTEVVETSEEKGEESAPEKWM